jgi:hypothetical protein
MKEYEVREEELESKLREIEEKLNYSLNRPVLISARYLSLEEKKKFLRLLVDRIIFHSHEGRVVIKGHIPIIKEEKSIEEYLKTFNENFTGTTSMMSWNRGQYPSNWLKFELKARI